jgi:hypothetical protein
VRLEHLLSGAEEAEEARWREAARTSHLTAREAGQKHLREWKADDGAERTWKSRMYTPMASSLPQRYNPHPGKEEDKAEDSRGAGNEVP